MRTHLHRLTGPLLLAGLSLAALLLIAGGQATAGAPADRPTLRDAASDPAPVSQLAAAPVLAVQNRSSHAFATQGDTITYTFILRNTGDAAAPATALSNTLPPGLDYISGTLSATAGAASYSAAGRRVSWIGDLAAGGRVTLTYAAALDTADYIYNTAVLTHPLAAAAAGATSSPADRWAAAETVDSAHQFDGRLGSWRFLAVDSAGAPHIAYGGDQLYYASLVGGNWVGAAVPVTPTNVTAAALVFDAADRPQIAFAAASAIWLARQTSGGLAAAWTLERVATPAWDSYYRGLLDLATGPDGRLHLAYNNTSGALFYTVREASGWLSPTLAFTTTGCTTSYSNFDPTRYGFSLAVDAANVARLACIQNNTQPREVRLYTATVAGPWTAYEVVTRTTPNVQWFYYPSLTYDGVTPHLSFAAYESFGVRLYHAWAASPWQTERVDTWPDITYAPLSTAMAVRGGQLAVAWSIRQNSQELALIRHAARPTTSGAWITRTLDSFANAGDSSNDALRAALALDAAGQAHVAYYYPPAQALRHAGQPTGWAVQPVDEGRTVGDNAVIAVEPGGRLHLAYPSAGIRYAVSERNTTTWTKTIAVAGPFDSWGTYLDLAVDAGGAPHILYGRSGGPLYHAVAPAGAAAQIGAAAWITRPVDTRWRGAAGPALALGAPGVAHAAYLADSGASTALRHAAFDGAAWVTETLAVVGPDEWGPQIVAQAGAVHILHLDCSASQPSGDYPISLALRTRSGGAWTSRTLTTFTGVCDWRITYELVAEGGRLAATLSRLLDGPTQTQIFWISDGVVSAGVETLTGPAEAAAAAGPAGIGWNPVSAMRGPGLELLTGKNGLKTVTYVDGAGYRSNEIVVGQMGGGYGFMTGADRAGRDAAATEYSSDNTLRIERVQPEQLCCLVMQVTPEDAARDQCEASATAYTVKCGSQVGVTATGAKGWAFLKWLGPVAPEDETPAQATVTGIAPHCTEATADFVKQTAIKADRPEFYRNAPTVIALGEELTYIITLYYNGTAATAPGTLTDPIPRYTDYIPGTAHATLGLVQYVGDENDGTIQWMGDMPADQEVVITWKVRVDKTELPAKRTEWPAKIPNHATAVIRGITYPLARETLIFNPIVNTTSDQVAGAVGDGVCGQGGAQCTLREALLETNYHPNRGEPDVISFNIPASGQAAGVRGQAAAPVIAVQSALPAVTDPVVVDGTTQAGGFVRVDGELAGAGVHGLQVAGGSTVKGLAITRFRGSGILLETGGSNTIQGNFIGTDDDGARSLGNRGDGVTVRNSTNNRIGGAGEALRNVIAGNWGNGIVISGATAAHNLITGNALGWMTWDLDRLGNQGDGLQITAAAHDNTIGSPEPDGGNTIVLNSRNGIALTGGAANNTIAGNFIGVETLSSNQSPDGQWQAAGNTLDGILVEGAPGNTIGGAATAARNVISANGNDGIELRGAAQLGTGVQGNFIGLLPSGRAAAGNQKYGIFLNESPGNTVGVGNVIAANREAGVALVGQGAAGNQVQGNCLGLDATCQAVLGAAQPYGIYLQGAPRNIIGGVQANLRNVIGNARVGIEIADPGAASNTVQGNYVGTEVTGQEPRAITEAGVRLDQAPDNIIGGSAAGQGNLIAGSQGSGIVIMGEGATRNLVRGNRIGVKADGVTALGNTLHGIHLGDSATGNAIGGTEANEGNLIAHNVRDGVFVESGTRNAILGNRIFANQEQGIDLAPGGWNPNDDGDNDDGPNKLQNAPMVTTTVGAGGTTIHGVLASQPGRTYRVEIFANPTYGSYQGEELLGAGNVTIGGDGRGSFVMNVTGARTAIAATATDPDGNTSEFSVVQIVVNRTSDEDDANIGDGVCDANPGTAGDQCTLRAAIQEANRRTGPDAVTFNIAGAGAIPIIRPGRALPAISDPIALDAITQPDSQRVILDGSAAGNNTHGLRLATGGSSLRGLLIRNFASGFGILLEGSRVELQNVTLTDNGRGLVAEGAVRLENVNISDNLGIGISNPLNDLVFDGLDNYVSGNGAYGISGLNITIRGVAIESNHCAGILARGNVVISERATINSNGANCTGGITDGINSAGSVEARNAEISHNVGAGIMVKANARLHNTKVNDNHGGGVFSYERGNITFEGDANQVNRNKANGITGYSVTASQLEVLSNDCVGIRALGKVMIDGGAVISHNGQGAACAARQGMSVDGLVRANNIEVEDNGDTGLMADGPVTLMNARLNNNAKAGLAMLLRGPLILRGYTQVNDNKANGIMAAGEVRAQNLEMIHNQCAGIVFLGQMEITGRANISRNGWDATCPSRNGIHAVQTDLVKAHNLTADSNGGWGIMAGQDVVLTNGRICSNGMGGIFANRNVTLTGVQVCSNQGSGVISGGDVISSTVNALNNLAAGPSEGASSLTFSQIANNTGDGIRLELPTTLTVTRTNIAGNAGLGVNNAVTTILESRLQPARSGERPAKASIPNVVMVDARGNWWGAVSGPGGAGPGAGDRVSAGVMFMPWRTTPVALVALPADDPLIAPIGVPITAAIYLRNWVAPTDTVRVQFRDAAGWLVAPTVVTVTLADETLGGTALVTITVPAGTAVGANDIVTATATSQISPTVTATAVFRVSAAHFADLSLEKRGPLAATTGEPFIYTLIVRNAGPHAATGVILTDTLPVTVTLAAVVATQGACNGAGTIVCTLATISATATATVSLTVTPYASGALWNTALATADALDPAPWNNTDAALTQSWAAPRQLYLPLVLRQ